MLAAQKQEAEHQQQEQERASEPERTKEPEPATITEEASATRCHRAKAVAARLGVHTQTLWRWIAENRFPQGILIGPGRRVWTEQQLAQWLDEQRANPGERRPLPSEGVKAAKAAKAGKCT